MSRLRNEIERAIHRAGRTATSITHERLVTRGGEGDKEWTDGGWFVALDNGESFHAYTAAEAIEELDSREWPDAPQ